jgi:4-diphosphocytidyl-2-C-methyl-D-erythritol kinase
MSAPLTTRARAKVNLDLKVLGRRSDGYHELESLVAFAGVGDLLTLEPGPELSLAIAGPFGTGLAADEHNLVLRAARLLAQEMGPLRWGRFHLVKRLPIASGIGGGSADAAAALRLLARFNGLSPSEPALLHVASQVGADVPVCLESRARVMTGIGERLGPALRLPNLFAVLVNPGVQIETAAVFRELGLRPDQASAASPARAVLPGDTDREALMTMLGRAANDLEPPALRIAPVLQDLLARLRDLPGCRLARMSGSGATCFALFDDCRKSAGAAKVLVREQPGWWVRPTLLR